MKFAQWGLVANYGPSKLAKAISKFGASEAKVATKTTNKHKSVVPKGVHVAKIFTKATLFESESSNPKEREVQSARDLLWVTQSELDELRNGRFPGTLRTRITLFHLVDNTVGLPSGWGAFDVKKAEYKARPESTKNGTRVALTGEFDLQSQDQSASYKGTLKGEVVFKNDEFLNLRMYFEGKASYPTTTESWPPARPYSLKIGFVSSKDELDQRILPNAAIYAESYDAYLHYQLGH